MNPDLFFENFELLADSPNGIQKLRELILQLAVMGKLVEQDPRDEPASMLIEKIDSEKNRLVEEGNLKKDNSLPSIEDEEVPFNIPQSWRWVRLGEVVIYNGGQKTSSEDIHDDAWILDLEDIEKNTSTIINHVYFKDRKSKSTKAEFKKGDVLYGKLRPYLNKVVVADDNGYCTTEIVPLSIYNSIDPYYLMYTLKRLDFLEYVNSKTYGTKMPRLGTEDARKSLFPFPPIAEQKRIVVKVDELMVLCDKLEAHRHKKQELQSKLNSAALEKMLSAENKEEFEQYWQHICENFDLIYDNPENVEKLRQVILQLAVQGKLVEQNPEDEPASVLIEKIKTEKKRVTNKGKIKKTKTLAQIDSHVVPYELPNKWEWVRIEDITDVGTGSTPLTSKHEYYEDGSIPWITSSLTSLDYIDKAETLITETAISECNLRIYPSGTLIVALYGQGKTRGQVSELRIEATINQACASIVFIENFDNIKKYVKLFFEQKYEELRALASGGAQPNLNVGKIKDTLIPLPPLAEQKRIVEKVEQLMGLCNELEAKLRKGREESQKLVEAVVKSLLENSSTTKSELDRQMPMQEAVILSK